MSTVVDPLHPHPLDHILTPSEQTTLSEDIKQKLTQSINELKVGLHDVRTQLQAEKVDYAQHTYDLDTDLRDKQQKLEALKQNLEIEQANAKELLTKYEKTNEVNLRYQEENGSLKIKLTNAEDKGKQIETNNQELLALIEKRNTEIEKLSGDVEKLNGQLEATTVAKIECMQKIDELTSREIEVKYRESHLQRESTYNQEQIDLLTKELERKNIELLNAQRESGTKYIHIQTELSDKLEQLKISEMKLADLKEMFEKSEKHVESLMEKLKNEGELRCKVEENYRVEVNSLKRVVELYKESTEDSTKKLEELEDAVQSLQDLLKESTEKYGQLETRFAESSRQLQEEISNRDEALGKYKAELKVANDVLESIQKHGMTDQMISSLSPAAAAASQMLKDSHSITEIFSRHQQLQVELNLVKSENSKLNGYIREILQDIESRAPILQKQKEEYERAMQTVEILSSQMDLTMRENSKCKTEIVQLKKNLGGSEREAVRLRGQIDDLAKQVRCLLGDKERESLQGDGIDGQEVVSRELVGFKNIEELQKQNLKLLTVVRELTEEREKSEREQGERAMGEINSAFTSALAELDELKAFRVRQDEKMKEVIQQRDTLNNLLKQKDIPIGTDIATEKLKQTEKDLVSLREEFDNYRTEKRENERMLNESNEKLREDISRMRTDNSRLSGQVEYNNERTKIYNKNLEGYKKQIAVLEERNRAMSEVVAKHEGSIQSLKNELHTTHTNLSRAEVSIQTLTNERNQLREAKNRLQLEKDMLQRHEKMTTMLQTNLEEIKNSLEMSNSAVRIKLENEIESLKSENSNLKRRIESEAEKNRQAFSSNDFQKEQLKEKLKNEEDKVTALTNEVTTTKATIEKLQIEINTMAKEPIDDLLPPQPPTDNLVVITLKSEVESLKNQLKLAKSNVDEYRSLSGVLEEQLSLANTTNHYANVEYETKLSEKESKIVGLQIELDNLIKEKDNATKEASEKIAEISEKFNTSEKEFSKLKNDYENNRSSLIKFEQELERVKTDLSTESKSKEELRELYEKEVILRGDEAKELVRFKSTVEELKTQLETTIFAKEKHEQALAVKEQELKQTKDSLEKEAQTLKEEIENLREACGRLEGQLVAALSVGKEGAEDVPLGGDKSSEQWLQLIRYLRREKEIAVGKMEMATAQSQRLESQLHAAEKRYEEAKEELGKVQGDEGAVGLLTSVKQAELLRKVETLSALGDSNRLLRDETNILRSKVSELQQKLDDVTESKISPLENEISQLTSQNESLSLENTSLSQEATRWKSRASVLIEKTNKVNPEEMKRLQTENEELSKKVTTLEAETKKLTNDYARVEKMFKVQQNSVVLLQGNVQSLGGEKGKWEGEASKLRGEVDGLSDELNRLRKELVEERKEKQERDGEMEKLRGELDRVEGLLEEHKGTVKQVKNIARKYKKQYEDLQAANETDNKSTAESTATQKSILESKLQETEAQVISANAKITDLEATLETTLNELSNANGENSRLTKELEMLRQRLNLIEKTFQKKEEPPAEDKLTASIRPMTVKETVVEQKLNVVQPMVQGLAPVSQAQVSTSTPEFSGFISRVVSVTPHVHQEIEENEEEGDEEDEEEEEEDEEEDGGEEVGMDVSSSAVQVDGNGGGSSGGEASSSTGGKRGREEESESDGEDSEGTKRGRIEEEEEEEEEEVEEIIEGEEMGREAEAEENEDDEGEVGNNEEDEEEEEEPGNISSTDNTATTPSTTQLNPEDISIVPSTPTLFTNRRTDGFSELQTPRFTFNEQPPHEDNTSTTTSRSVPSTPAPTDEEDHGNSGHQASEVPSSSTSTEQQNQQKTRPTPIVWDQPSSSSSGQVPSLPPSSRGALVPRVFPRGATTSPRISRSNVTSTFTRGGVQRGGQSARRSRPGTLGGLSGRGFFRGN